MVEKYGRLTVLERFNETTPNGRTNRMCRAKCDCGKVVSKSYYSLRRGNTSSCGCLLRENGATTGKNRLKDISGHKFGSLTAIRQMPKTGKGTSSKWLCLCDCGKEHSATSNNLQMGRVKSCGCLKRTHKR